MRRKESGFTLIELIMVMLLLSIVSVMAGKMLMGGYQGFITTQNINETDWRGFIAMERIMLDIRNIRSINDISTASSSQLVFTNNQGTSITYSLSGNSLLRNSQVLTDHVQSFTINYYTASGTSTSSIAAMEYFTVTLTVNVGTVTQSFSSMVFARDIA